MRSGAPIASPIAEIESDEVFVATRASGACCERCAEDSRLQLEVLREGLDQEVGAGRGVARVAGGRHAARGRAHLVRGEEHVPVDQRESLVDALLRAPEVPRVQPHLVTSERVLAPDLGSHQARTDDRHAHGS